MGIGVRNVVPLKGGERMTVDVARKMLQRGELRRGLGLPYRPAPDGVTLEEVLRTANTPEARSILHKLEHEHRLYDFNLSDLGDVEEVEVDGQIFPVILGLRVGLRGIGQERIEDIISHMPSGYKSVTDYEIGLGGMVLNLSYSDAAEVASVIQGKTGRWLTFPDVKAAEQIVAKYAYSHAIRQRGIRNFYVEPDYSGGICNATYRYFDVDASCVVSAGADNNFRVENGIILIVKGLA